MSKPLRGDAPKQLRTLFNLGTIGELTDGQLLERFLSREGEAAELAFAALVERHGPMVLRTCRAVLRDGHEAEDAFQATFQILARKARGLWVRDSLGPWIHAVAIRTARRARSEAARRRRAETRAAESAARTAVDAGPEGLVEALHEELGRLPERYRAAVVLCCLEGLSLVQAARHLGWPVGTVQSRLARGRQRLRERLARHGLAPSAGAFGAALAAERAQAAVPIALAEATTRAAMDFVSGSAAGAIPAAILALSEGVLRSMAMPKMIALGLALMLVGISGAGAVVALASHRDDPPAGSPAAEEPDRGGGPRPPAPVELEAVALAGETLVAVRDDAGNLVPRQGNVDFETKRVPISMVAAVGVFDQRALQRAIGEAEPGRATPIEIAYRRVELQRQRLGADGNWSAWETIDPVARRKLLLDVAFLLEIGAPAEVSHEELVAWIPYLEDWRDRTHHLVAARFRDRPVGGAIEPDRPLGTGRETPEQRMSVGRAMLDLRPIRTREPALMIRAVDPTVVPRETYRYRARVVIDDHQAGLQGRREVEGEWSEATGPIEALDPVVEAERREAGEPRG